MNESYNPKHLFLLLVLKHLCTNLLLGSIIHTYNYIKSIKVDILLNLTI